MSSSMRCACARKSGQSEGSSVSRFVSRQACPSGGLSREGPLSTQNVSVATNKPSCRLLSAECSENFIGAPNVRPGTAKGTLQSYLETGDYRVRQRGARADATAARETQGIPLHGHGHPYAAPRNGGGRGRAGHQGHGGLGVRAAGSIGGGVPGGGARPGGGVVDDAQSIDGRAGGGAHSGGDGAPHARGHGE